MYMFYVDLYSDNNNEVFILNKKIMNAIFRNPEYKILSIMDKITAKHFFLIGFKLI